MSQETPVETETGGNSWGLGGWSFVVAAFAIGFINFPLRIVGWQFDHLPGDALDNRLNNYILEHGYRYWTGRADSFWDAPFFYPARHTTTYSDAHLGMLPFYSALRLAGLPPECAFQGWFIIPFILNFASAAWALRRLGLSYAGAAVGAYVFAFGLPLSGQLGHAQLLPRFLVPPAVVSGWEFLRRPLISRLAACCACVVGQVYISVYIGYFLMLLLASGAVVSVLRYRSQLPREGLVLSTRSAWKRRLVVISASFLALLPLGWAHARGVGAHVDLEVIRKAAPPLGGWITPTNVAQVSPLLVESPSSIEGEHKVFPGFVALFAVGIGIIATTRSARFGGRISMMVVAAWSTLLLALLVTSFDGIWLYRPVAAIPGVGSVRAVGRIVLVLLFPIAVLIGAIVDVIIERSRRYGRKAGALAAVTALTIVAADNWLSRPDGDCASTWIGERSPREVVLARQDRIKNAVKQQSSPALLYVFPSSGETSHEFLLLQLDAMRASQDLGVPCVNGYSGYFPRGWDFFSNRVELMRWLDTFGLPPDRLSGLVLIGEPSATP